MNLHPLLTRLGMNNPIILAPMGGGPCTPQLVAAVSEAGGLGSLAAAYLTPQRITDECARVRELTNRPFCINLFAGGYESKQGGTPEQMLAILSRIHQRFGLREPKLPGDVPDPFPAQFEAVLQARPAAFSFTFGIPEPAAIERAKALDIVRMGTATTVQEARQLAAAGVDAIIAQGSEAGAHRGTFAGRFEDAMVPTLELVREIASEVDLPVIASGGIMDGHDIRAALDAGAVGVQLGTAFLACPESGASEAYKRAILSARSDTTVITRAFSGRPARGLRNEFIAEMEGREDVILPFPLQNVLTRPMRTAANQRGDTGYLSLWAGQGVARARSMPAAELVARLVDEMMMAAA